MLKKLFSALSRLFNRKQFGGNEAITDITVDTPQEWTNKQY